MHFTKINPLNQIPKSFPGLGHSYISTELFSMTMGMCNLLILFAGGPSSSYGRVRPATQTESFMANSATLINNEEEKRNRGIIVGLRGALPRRERQGNSANWLVLQF